MTEITTIVSGQTVFFHELSDAEMDNALQTLPTTQVKILVLAGQGLSSKEICGETGIKTSTLTAYKKRDLFRNAFYTMSLVPRAITTETIRSLARRHAVDLIEQLSSVAFAPTDGSPAELRNVIKASVELLKIAGLYDTPTINVYHEPSIVEQFNRAIREGTRPPHPWEPGGELRLR